MHRILLRGSLCGHDGVFYVNFAAQITQALIAADSRDG
jgi:hypothetical protein